MPEYLSYSEQKKRGEMFQQGLLWCNFCNNFLPIDEFYKNSQNHSNYGYRYYCKKCEYLKRDKRKVKKYFKDKNYALKKEAISLAGGECQRCGYSEFVTALEFHHVYPSTKKDTPTHLLYSKGIQEAWEEIDKCCLLCRNCHGGYTGNEWKAEFAKREGLGWTIGEPLSIDDNRYDKTPIYLPKASIPDTLKSREIEQLTLL